MKDYPKWIYRKGEGGEIESKIIDAPPVPDDWCESPADVDKPKAPVIPIRSRRKE